MLIQRHLTHIINESTQHTRTHACVHTHACTHACTHTRVHTEIDSFIDRLIQVIVLFKVRPAYRLRSGVMPWQGRVEVLYSNVWGTVCDIGFNYHSCNVLCRSLGYGTCKSILTRASYGRGIGKVWMNEVKCTGTEQYLHECNRLPWGNARNCGEHAGDVGVECHVPDVYDHQPEIVSI